MEAPTLAQDLSLKTPTARGYQKWHVVAEDFTPTGMKAIVGVHRFKEGLRIEQDDAPKRRLDLHYSQVDGIRFVGHETYTEDRSVVGRAVVGKVVAGETGALVGALSGLQKDSSTSTYFAITYWDVKSGSWKQQVIESIDNGVILMQMAAEDLQVFRDGTDPDQLPDPTKVDRIAKKIVGYGIAGIVGIAILWWILSGVIRGVSDWWSRPSRPAPEVSSGPVPTFEQQVAAQQRGSSSESSGPLTTAPPITPNTASPEASTTTGGANTAASPVMETKAEPATTPAVATPTDTVQAQPVTQAKSPTQVNEADSGPSFDCTKASSAQEKAICASTTLAALDRSLHESYVTARQGPDAVRVQEDQQMWLKQRARCKDDACLMDMYKIRIAQLGSYRR